MAGTRFAARPAWRAWVAVLALAAPAPAVLAGKLVVYSSADADALKMYAEAFSKAHPGIQVEWVRDSTGAMQRKILAEGDKLRADVVFAHTAANLAQLAQAGRLQPYAPKGLERVGGRFLDTGQPPTWVGLYAWSSAMCVTGRRCARRAPPRRPSGKTCCSLPSRAR